VTIAVDGSLFRYHPNFQKTLEKTLKKLIDPSSISFQIVLSTDGSGRGAAVVASIMSNSNSQSD
jgi:hexokinase